jgi:hypothetical protein
MRCWMTLGVMAFVISFKHTDVMSLVSANPFPQVPWIHTRLAKLLRVLVLHNPLVTSNGTSQQVAL